MPPALQQKPKTKFIKDEKFICISTDNKPYEAKIVKIITHGGMPMYVVHFKGTNAKKDVKIPIGGEEGKMFKGDLHQYYMSHAPPPLAPMPSRPAVKHEIVERDEEPPQIPPSQSDNTTEMLQKILENLEASDTRNRELQERISTLEQGTSNGPIERILTVSEETIRAESYYLRKQSVVVDAQAKMIEELMKEKKNTETNIMRLVGMVQQQITMTENERKKMIALHHNLLMENQKRLPGAHGFSPLPQNSRLPIMPNMGDAQQIYNLSPQPCIFCDIVGHPSIHCPRYPTLAEKRGRLEEKNLCVRCLAPNTNTTGSKALHDPCPQKDRACPACSHMGLAPPATRHHLLVCPRYHVSTEPIVEFSQPRRSQRQRRATPY
uniref:Uncharacterized protein n=1 Tax=Caenorhabditis tropicalis TaxID=1561998 RepID=A0A1I7TTM2_9PELO